MAETVRFSAILKTAGKPQTYLPLSDPKRDKDFMRAVREDRVVSLKQEPTGTKKDFGSVGFLPERYISYLIFPKPLTAFKDKRIVGIKYDALADSISTPRTSARSLKPPRPKPKPKPRPKRFTATVRLTSTNEIKVTVEAMNEDEARKKAETSALAQRGKTAPRIETELRSLKPSGN
jgi:hypothetical protein